MMRFKNFIYVTLTGFAILVTGCVTTSDLRVMRSDINRQMEERLVTVDQRIGAVQVEQEKNTATLASMRKGQANTAADFTELRDQIQQLRGQVEELRKDINRPPQRDDSYDKKLDNLLLKVNFIENFLEIGRKHSLGTAYEISTSGLDAAGKPEKATLYANAYQLFSDGRYTQARTAFEEFLVAYPKSEYSDNAQFWIGECYFFEKKYEQAILEYEKVTKNYPEGNRVSYALLKQGLSFFNLGDKVSARLLLQQVIKDYPNTNQARIARAKLQEIK